MSETYLAVVKYAVDATDAEKVSALKEGIVECAASLVEEFGISVDDVEDVLDEALTTAHWSEASA